MSSALPEAKPSFAASTPTTCGDDVLAWAARASARTNLELIPADCPRGVVRFHVTGVGCDFEVTTARDIGFRRTPDGAFGVSPIVDVEWEDAPMRMKGALDGLIAALVADPALPVPSGDRVLGGTEGHETGSPSLGRRLKLASLAAVALLALVAVIYRLARRRRIARGSSATPDA